MTDGALRDAERLWAAFRRPNSLNRDLRGNSGEYRFEFAFICSHSSVAFQNVSWHAFGAPATCLQVTTSVFGGVEDHLPVLWTVALAGGPAGLYGAFLLDIAIPPSASSVGIDATCLRPAVRFD